MTTVNKKQPIPPNGTPEGITPHTKCIRTVQPNKITYNDQEYDISGPENKAAMADFIAALEEGTDSSHSTFAAKWAHLKMEKGAPVAYPYTTES
jgi:hypothetical protein